MMHTHNRAWGRSWAVTQVVIAGLVWPSGVAVVMAGGSPDNPVDLDVDGDVDTMDFAAFSACMNGSDNSPKAGCTNLGADLDADGDVDGFDFLSFTTMGQASSLPVRSADGSDPVISSAVGALSLLLSSTDDNGPNDANPAIGVIQYKNAPTTIPVTVQFSVTTSGSTGSNYGVFAFYASLTGTALGDNTTKRMVQDATFKRAMGASFSDLWSGPQGLGFDAVVDLGTGGVGQIAGFGAAQDTSAAGVNWGSAAGVNWGSTDAQYSGHPAGSHPTVAHNSRSGVAYPLLSASEQYVGAVGPVTAFTGSLVPAAMVANTSYAMHLTGQGSLYWYNNANCQYESAPVTATGNQLIFATLGAGQPPVIADIPDHATAPGVPYSRTPALMQGMAPITWSLVTGPSGMTVDASTGVVSWADPQPAESSHLVQIRAANSVGSDDESWTLTVNAIAPVIADIPDHATAPGVPYSRTPTLMQGTAPITWSLVTGPSGMTVDASTGVVSWADPQPAESSHLVQIRAANSAGSDDESWTLTVNGIAPVIADIPDHATAPGMPYSRTPTLMQGTAPITWSLVTGPSGMTVDASTGVVSWADPQPAESSHLVQIRAANSVGSDEESWTLTVNAIAPVIADIPDHATAPGVLYSRTPTLMQGTAPITWSLVTGPSGMTVDASTGVVSWADPQPAESSHLVQIRAANSVGSDEESWTLTVNAIAPVIADILDHATAPGMPYSRTPTLMQGTAPITWSLVTGPSGMTVDASTGVVSWADPQPAEGSHLVQIRAANSVGGDDESWSLTIKQITDCNGNGIEDDEDITTGTSKDCNGNSVPDECDVRNGTSKDCNGNLVPDECEPDCNNNETADGCDLTDGTSADCNGNSIPDECDIQNGTSKDWNGNSVPDECDIQNGTSHDWNGNSVPDESDIQNGTSKDCDANGIPDECERDCNNNDIPDTCDLSGGTSTDRNGNGIPDDCDLANGTSKDEDGNNVPDECEAILKVETVGEGRISRLPAKSRYIPGEMVELEAKPADGWRFVGWSGDTTAYTNVISVYMRPVTRLTATFENPSPIPTPWGTYHAVVGAGVQFDGSGCRDPLGEALTLTWNFGDGTTGEGPTPTHAYAQAGYYIVILTVRDTGGNIASSRLTAIISEPIPTPPDDDPSDSTNDADSQTPSTPTGPVSCMAIDYLTLTMLLAGLTLMRFRPRLA